MWNFVGFLFGVYDYEFKVEIVVCMVFLVVLGLVSFRWEVE